MALADVEIVQAGTECVAELEPLYHELHDHHVAVAPRLAGLAPRTAQESWERRLERYADWLARPHAFVLVAQQHGRPVGYAVASTTGGYQSWASEERVGEVHDLVVAGGKRGTGIGTALMEAVERRLRTLGIREYRVMLIEANDAAHRFYVKRGMTQVSRVMLGRIDAR
ncbi:MAG TPA: GNAT family N-acetyltransferase [Solirubrobacteraceae bacterium]|jgi:GNAT superfamily N-acetyltransferase|nr:GNAT family N-acetyltransferase [Solirubrobacteraceae bacterium]